MSASTITAHVTYRRDPWDVEHPEGERGWLVSDDDEPRIHTDGETLDEARANAREAEAVWHDVDPETVELVERVAVTELVERVVEVVEGQPVT